jgi:type III pantothenate kinase
MTEGVILLVDAGNTRVKFGWIDPARGRREPAALALHHGALERLPRWLAALPRQPRLALGVNVAGTAVARAIAAQLSERGCALQWVSSRSEALGVRNGYRDPGQLGPDRWVSLLALARLGAAAPDAASSPAPASEAAPAPAPQASADHVETGCGSQPPLMLASFGTATTIDTLGPDLVFRGGLIFPGPALMRSSLAQGTANLPEADGDTVPYPVHTHQAISTGIAAAQAGAVLRQWLAGLDHYGQPPLLYSAGGGWPAVQEETAALLARTRERLGLPAAPIAWLPTPVLDGLALLAGARAQMR